MNLKGFSGCPGLFLNPFPYTTAFCLSPSSPAETMGAGGPRRGAGPPDGGWGWVVLGACFVITGFAYGFPKAVSVFFRELKRDFGAGYSDTAWVSSIMLAMLYGTGQHSSRQCLLGSILGLGI